jgi:hypothetical protein
MGYGKAVRDGEIKILSIRRPSGKPLFTIEAQLAPRRRIDEEPKFTHYEQIKGKANRLPGFDLGKTGTEFPIKRDEVKRVYEFVEGGPYTSSNIAVDDIRDMKPAVKQVNALFRAGDPWAVKLMTDLGIEDVNYRMVTKGTGESLRENPGPACGLHDQKCTGFCRPYQRRR